MKKALVALLIIIFGLTVLVGCWSDEKERSEGPGETSNDKYYMVNHFLSDGTDAFQRLAETDYDPDDQYLEFLDDKRCTMHYLNGTINMTYTIEGNTITYLEEFGLTNTGTIDGNRITVETEQGEIYVFEKRS